MKKFYKLLSLFVSLCILATTLMCVPVVASDEEASNEELNYVENELLVTVSNELYNGIVACDTITEIVEANLDSVAQFGIETLPGHPVGDSSSMYKVILNSELDEEVDILEICESINSSTDEMYAEPNYIFELTECSSAEKTEFETAFGALGTTSDWHFRDTWSKEALALSEKKGDDVLVAVIDTGCNFNHEHLQNSMISFSVGENTYHGLNACNTEDAEFDPYDITDNYGHGTAVSSVISGANSNGSFTGVASNSKILPIKISDQKTFDTDDILGAINLINYYNTYIAGIGTNSPLKVSVVNMSFSFRQTVIHKDNDSCLKTALQELLESCVLVAAAGNGREGTAGMYCNYPAAFDCVIGVMAYAPDMKMARYSNYNNSGSFYEIAAPGTYIKTANFADADGYSYLSGTSFASPMVVGAVALYLSNFPNATITRVKNDLLNSMVDTVAPYYSNDSHHYKLNVVDYLNLGLLDQNGTYSLTSDDILWTYNHNDRSLTFNGYEEILDYNSTEAPWYRFRNLTNSCTISDDVIYVGGYTLYNFNKMETLTIGPNVEYIGDYACLSCKSLESINIPPSVTEIGMYAFSQCTNVTSLVLPPILEYTNVGVFEGCSSLTTVLIPNGWTEIPSSTFMNCSSLQTVALPDTLTKIGVTAFKNCTQLSNVSLPVNLNQIGSNAFANCTSLESIVTPHNLTRIDTAAFSGCSNLQDITLYDNITTMKTRIFDGCTEVTVKAYKNSMPLTYAQENAIDYEIICRLKTSQDSGIIINGNDGTITAMPSYVSTGTFLEQYVYLDDGLTLAYEGLVSGYITQGTVIKVFKGETEVESYEVR